MEQVIEIYTDGCALNNQNEKERMAGWAAVLKIGKWKKKIGAQMPGATNNEAELTAVMKALSQIKEGYTGAVKVYSDSQYVINGLNKWLDEWISRSWKSTSKEEIKNKDLWINAAMAHYRLLKRGCKVEFVKIPREENSEADGFSKKYASGELF